MAEIPPTIPGPADYIEPQDIIKLLHTLSLEEDANRRLVIKRDTLLQMSHSFVQVSCVPDGIAGDANSDGTLILAYALPPGRRLIVTKVMGSYVDTAGPAAAGLAIGSGPALPVTAVDLFPLPTTGGSIFAMVDGTVPVLVFNGGTTGTTVILFAPATFLGNVNNNANTRTFCASLAGVLI